MQGHKEDVWSLVKSVCVPAFLCAKSAFLQFRWFWSWIKMDELPCMVHIHFIFRTVVCLPSKLDHLTKYESYLM